MKLRFLTITALALLASQGAHAGTIFNSNVTQPPAGNDGNSDQVSAMAVSFTTTQVPNIASLVLSAANPTDGGSIMVYLVADDGTGAGAGFAGNPTYTSSGAAFTGFTNGVLLGTIADSSLTSTPTVQSLSISSSAFSTISGLTSNQEYWIGISVGDGSGEWAYDPALAEGIGYAGQNNFAFITANDPPGTTYPDLPLSEGLGPYQLTVAVPEPISLSIMGVGLIGLGVARRRAARKV
jgi:hypothetical protein